MSESPYERYGLTGSPFRDLASESLDDVEVFHVHLPIDDQMKAVLDEVLAKENRAFVGIVGPMGTGKTEHLRYAQSLARQGKAFTVYFDVPAKATWVLKEVASEFQQTAKAAKLTGVFSTPGWLRGVAALQKVKERKYDAVRAGKAIAKALNATAPSALLLNDLQNLTESGEAHLFTKTLQEIADGLKPGAMVIFGAYPSYLNWMGKEFPALASRINRLISLPSLSNDEASLLLAKKLLAKRLVEDLDPLYPFDRLSVAAMNSAVAGNPRRLLDLADRAMQYGIDHRANRIDVDIIEAVRPPPTVRPAAPPSTVAPVREAPPATPASVLATPAAARLAPPKRLPDASTILGPDSQ
jgi:type II secretory pathway predicted ATPase ExeA